MAKRLNKITREFNVGITTIVDFLASKGHDIDSNPNTKIPDELYEILEQEYSTESSIKKQSKEIDLAENRKKQEVVSLSDVEEKADEEADEEDVDDELPEPKKISVKVVGKMDVDSFSKKPSQKKEEAEKKEDSEVEDELQESEESEELEEIVEVPDSEETSEVESFEDDAEEEDSPEEKSAETKSKEEEVFSTSEREIENNVRVVGQIDLSALNQKTRPDKKSKKEKEQERKERKVQLRKGKEAEEKPVAEKEKDERTKKKEEIFTHKQGSAKSPKVVGQIKLEDTDDEYKNGRKKRRKRIKNDKIDLPPKGTSLGDEAKGTQKVKDNKKRRKGKYVEELSAEEIDKQIKDTMAKMGNPKKTKSSKYRREKRDAFRHDLEEQTEKSHLEQKILKVTEFISANELSNMMDVDASEIISTCMSIGLFISLNQRLDAETIQMIAEEFGYQVQFVTVDIQEGIVEEDDNPEDLQSRPPIVTVMGHVDHGKTSLLDYVRKANVIAGEAGGITQHIAAYTVKLNNDKRLTFLDTPGHEAFTAMRARGTQVTDVAIIVIAADDSVMPQTVEAINHAAAAGVPIVFAINKVDKENSNSDKIREQLANMNYLVEDWGGKYQSQEISAKFGKNIEELMEKVLFESELLELKANPNKKALGTIIESELDKGSGYVSTVLVSSGMLRVGDVMLAGMYTGKVKAMYNERGQRVAEAGPSVPVTILGLDGAPQAGDRFHVLNSEKEARDIANKRERLQREQELNAQKHVTLDEIGRRIAIGNFQELNVIIKGDVDGSIEALADSIVKLSTEEIVINVKHKAVGQISESDVLLASASDAIIIGFQVRPSAAARKLAEKEGIDIRLYSIIYDAINELRDAMSGMLSPEIKEEIIGTAEIRETFKIPKAGTVAGCFVIDGKISRNSKVRLIRDGIVIYTGELGSLKRFKDDVKEVTRNFECGLNIANFNDIKIADHVEAYEEREVKRTL
ncbi:MAG: translation initiation factor IF-2 [Bacteroidales bacterium]|jgi:translation initiation factor IF-2|nr:translation initiation factor IF-2 [Bacteroidales bacterium]